MSKSASHIPVRMCFICRERGPKTALQRYTRLSDGQAPVLDEKQKAPGRGLYLCGDPRCQEAFSRRQAKRNVKGRNV